MDPMGMWKSSGLFQLRKTPGSLFWLPFRASLSVVLVVFPSERWRPKGGWWNGIPWGVLDYLGISHYPPMAEVFVFPILFGFRISRWDDHLFLYVFFLSFTPCFSYVRVILSSKRNRHCFLNGGLRGGGGVVLLRKFRLRVHCLGSVYSFITTLV